MKNLTKVFAYFFFFLMLGFVACKSSTTVEPSTSIIGKWKITTATNKGASASDFKYFQQFVSTVWEFKSDKTFTVDGSDLGVYAITGNTFSVNSKGNGTISISGSTMTWLNNDDKVEFGFTRQ
jgi:putative NADH-flavin reductase